MRKPRSLGAHNKKAPITRGLFSQNFLRPLRDAASYFFFFGAAFFFAAFLVAFFID